MTAPATEECDKCGGWGSEGMEEDTGCAFTCFACNATGRVPLGTHAAEMLAMARHNGFDTVEAYDAELKRRNDEHTQKLAAQRQPQRPSIFADDDFPF